VVATERATRFSAFLAARGVEPKRNRRLLNATIAKSLLTAPLAIMEPEASPARLSTRAIIAARARALACLWTEINPSRSFDGSPGATNCRLIHQASGGCLSRSSFALGMRRARARERMAPWWTRDTRALIFAVAARCESRAGPEGADRDARRDRSSSASGGEKRDERRDARTRSRAEAPAASAL